MSANNKQWQASVVFAAPRRDEVESLHYAPIEADSQWAAARQVARWAAQYRYQEFGDTNGVHLASRGTSTVFRASIGRRPRSDVGRLEGTSIVITLTPVGRTA